ncbi:MAG: hypothetical protein RBU21_09065 [FCB group bacterium]|nr:hypothetical protein [FCB group bacterium]
MKDKPKKGCFRRGCLRPLTVLVPLYVLWSLWTGWLGPDRVDTWGASIPGVVVAGLLDLDGFSSALNQRKSRPLDESLNGPVPRSLERPAVGAEDPQVAKGRRLPREFAPKIFEKYYKENDLAAVFSGDYVVRNAFEKTYITGMEIAAGTLWGVYHSEAVVEWQARRADVLPPQRIDSLMYFHTLGETLSIQPHPAQYWKNTHSHWKRMANGKNPYWRLRAVNMAHFWTQSWPEARQVYLEAFKEQEPEIVKMALRRIAGWAAGDKEAQNAIKQVWRDWKPKPNGQGDKTVSDLAQVALETLGVNLVPSSDPSTSAKNTCLSVDAEEKP